MKTTAYFQRNITEKRPEVQMDWCIRAVESPDDKVLQNDGRIRYYKLIIEVNRFLRVIVLEDGKTLHNAFFDRNYKPKEH